jgi:hypothetical protein
VRGVSVGNIEGLQMATQEEIIAMLKATYDMRDASNAMAQQADADEAAIDALITKCGYDAFELVRKAYTDGEGEED